MTTLSIQTPVETVIDQDVLPPDVARIRCAMVNCYLLGELGAGEWVLIDAGLPFYASTIIETARRRFGDAPPRAIILTHGHFDHVGSLAALLRHWRAAPVYAHELELPFLTGQSDYPPADPTVGGGMMARTSPLLPRRAYDFRPRVAALSPDGQVPFLPRWRWIATPGHSPGHVSLFREEDRALVAGDAFVTQKQESFYGVISEDLIIHGPPAYFTIDWAAAAESVRRLAALEPRVAATGHGKPMANPRLAHDLHWLARNFEELAVPRDGRYVREPAVADYRGIVRVPPAVHDWRPWIIAGLAIAGIGLGVRYRACRNHT